MMLNEMTEHEEHQYMGRDNRTKASSNEADSVQTDGDAYDGT